MSLACRLCTIAALAAAAASPAAGATGGRPASTQTSPKVLHVVTTGFDIQLTPTIVGAAPYTVQVHNISGYTVHVTIGKLVDVTVKPNGWQFRDVVFKHAATYAVHAVALPVHVSWAAVLSSQ